MCVYRDGPVWGRGNSCTSPRVLWYHENALSLITQCVCVSLTVLPTYTHTRSRAQRRVKLLLICLEFGSLRSLHSLFRLVLWYFTVLRKTRRSRTQLLEDCRLTTNTVMTSVHTELDTRSGREQAETWRHIVIWQLMFVMKIKEVWLESLKLSQSELVVCEQTFTLHHVVLLQPC